jgi:hypothetical protein
MALSADSAYMNEPLISPYSNPENTAIISSAPVAEKSKLSKHPALFINSKMKFAKKPATKACIMNSNSSAPALAALKFQISIKNQKPKTNPDISGRETKNQELKIYETNPTPCRTDDRR